MIEIPKFLINENFTYLIKQLAAYRDPNVTYKGAGKPELKGGQRIMYRAFQHYAKYAIVVKSPPHEDINFGSTHIECDKFDVSHDTFRDSKLKEKYKEPKEQIDEDHYTVLVTSKESLKNKTATRYYVSCNCKSFNFTFKEKLIEYGYTNGEVVKGDYSNKKPRFLAPAMCKHIYTVIVKEYADLLKEEEGQATSSAMDMPWHVDKEEAVGENEVGEPAFTYSKGEEEEGETYLDTIKTLPPPKKKGRVPKNYQQKKKEYEDIIKKSLKFFNNIMPNNIDVYRDVRQTNSSYKKYKFTVKKYPTGYVIVFTNPLLNPMRDKIREKEMMPLMSRTAKGMVPTADSIMIYTKKDQNTPYFTKDELIAMIKSETSEIKANQIERLKKTLPKYTLSESLEIFDRDCSSILLTLLGLY